MAIFRVKAATFRWKSSVRLLVLLCGGTSFAAMANDFQFDNGIQGTYKLTMNYGLGMRMKDPAKGLTDGPVDPFQPQLLPNPAGGQFVGFTHTGLPTTINLDDGDRNFKKHDLINNRFSMYGEFQSTYKNYGMILSGDAFYDDVYNKRNSNDSPETINKTRGDNNEFSKSARYYAGHRARILDAYAYGDWDIGEAHLNVRVGQQVVAWGESLFFSGVALSQGRADAAVAFVPGAEIKEILLPTPQIGAQLQMNRLTFLAYYHFDFRPTEVFPVGHYFSPADVVGPGAEFAYGALNPANGSGCPGLLGPASPICAQNGIGGPLLNAPKYITVTRERDIEPSGNDEGGLGVKFALTPITTIGLYRLRYSDPNPTVKLNVGYAYVGSLGGGVPITTQVINQPVPVTYNVKYFGGIDMTSVSLSTNVGAINVSGEINYRQGVDTPVQAEISGVVSPIYTRSDMGQILVSAIYAANPKFIFDDYAAVFETGFVHVYDVDAVKAEPGINPRGNGDELFYDKSAFGYQFLFLGKKRNVLPGWDATANFSLAELVNGNSPLSGGFGALYGEGDRRIGIGAGMQYLQNLEFGISYNIFNGDPDKLIGDSPLPRNPFADRDYMTFNIKYSL